MVKLGSSENDADREKRSYPISHAYAEQESPQDVALFVAISCELTGFSEVEIFGTGQVLTYFQIVTEHLKQRNQNFRELSGGELPGASFSAENEAYLRELRTTTPCWAKLAASLIKLWYLGQWYNPDDPQDTWIPSSQSYANGLVWDAIQAHPQGAKQQGFAAWAFPPSSSPVVKS